MYKKYEEYENVCDISCIKWISDKSTDIRVINAMNDIASYDDNGIEVYVEHKEKDTEGYTITIHKNKIHIFGDSAAGAFYGLMTFKQLIKKQNENIKCCYIEDYPDMKYRGFYQDISRGRIPTLESLKKLVDLMAENKLNSLQLYIEHTFDFKEYEFCRNDLGCITSDEVKALDKYCKDRFIDLIPSLSCFGHLYHLLQSDKYKHLCELKDYKPNKNHFIERMFHHTINPLLDESFELIKSLIDQHISAFSSKYFNICCDETFDLGTGVNKNKDKGDMYISFVKKLVDYIESKGKTAMMWGDIVLEHPEKISDLSDNIIFLNWDYERKPNGSRVQKLKHKKQIVCPGTSSWQGFSEKTSIEVPNIIKLAEYGYKNNAIGILNTNWGDLGNIASIDMAMYGLTIGAMVGWDKNFRISDEWKSNISEALYGDKAALSLLEDIGEIECQTNWRAIIEYPFDWQKMFGITELVIKNTMNKCNMIIERIDSVSFKNNYIRNEFLIASQGYALLCKWYAKCLGYNIETKVDFNKWLKAYENAWLTNSKQSELNAVMTLFKKIDSGEFWD